MTSHFAFSYDFEMGFHGPPLSSIFGFRCLILRLLLCLYTIYIVNCLPCVSINFQSVQVKFFSSLSEIVYQSIRVTWFSEWISSVDDNSPRSYAFENSNKGKILIPIRKIVTTRIAQWSFLLYWKVMKGQSGEGTDNSHSFSSP